MTESAVNEPFSLFTTSALLGDDLKVSALGSDGSASDGWVVGVQHVAESWAEWRRQPDGDALLFLLWGAAVVLTTQDPAEDATSDDLKAASAFIVPSGTWYRVTVEEPSNLLTAVRAGGTESRPVS
ncbi:MAG: hypothetical protein F4X20_01395 [Dehalococcoidia bacterium]|nr:hypothetical protein [Dehalococcoidia bacterium]